MITSVSFDSDFADRLLNIEGFRCGILVGGTLDTQECLFLPIEIPRKEENEGGLTKFIKFEEVSDISEKWIRSHSKNLSRMIPGGVHISGICITMNSSDFETHSEHIRRILFNLYQEDPMVTKFITTQNWDKIVLLIDPETKKFSCKSIKLEKNDATFRTINFKITPILDRWVALKTHISLSLETHLPSDRKKEKILCQLQDAVEPYLQSLVTETQLLINGEFRSSDEKLFKESENAEAVKDAKKPKKTSQSKRSDSGFGDVTHSSNTKCKSVDRDFDKAAFSSLDIVIFGPQFPRWHRASSSSSLESGASSDTNPNNENEAADSSSSGFVPVNRLVVNGRIPGIAFLPSHSTIGELLEALRKDLIHSIFARLQLLTEELHITSAELEVPRMLLPQRVLVRLPPCPTLPLSDYKFISETSDDVVKRLIYFCSPFGTAGSGDSIEQDILRPDSASSHTTTTSIAAATESSVGVSSHRDRIDASCLDTTLEKSLEVNADDEYSESELIDEKVESIPPTNQFDFNVFTSVLIGSSLLVLIMAILLAYSYYKPLEIP